MNPSSEKISTEIQKLLQSLNEENYDSVVHQLSQYLRHGKEESILLAEMCLHHFKVHEEDLTTKDLEPAVASLFRSLMKTPHFCEVFSGLFRNKEITEEFLDGLSTALKLSLDEKLGLGIALTRSERYDVKMAGRIFCTAQLELLHDSKSLRHMDFLSEGGDNMLQELAYKHASDASQSKEFLGSWNPLTQPDREFGSQGIQLPGRQLTPQNLIQHDQVLSSFLPVLLKDASMRGLVHHLWHVNPPFFSSAINAFLNLNPEDMNIVVDLFQELEILLPLLDLLPISLGIRLAALASQKNFIDLEDWLSTNLSIYEDMFFEECLSFLKEVESDVPEPSDRPEKKSGENWDLYKEAAPTFSKVLQVHSSLVSSNQLSKKMESLCITSMHSSPMMETVGDPDHSSTFDAYGDKTETETKDKAYLMPSSHTNPNVSTSGKVSVATSSGSVSIQKPQFRSSALNASSPAFSPPSRAVTSARFGSALGPGTLLAAAGRRKTPIEAPSSKTQDIISFIVNSLSDANIEAKAREFTEFLEEKYYPWFAQYLVIKRVSIEPNFHMLYINFLEKASLKLLMGEIIRETYENCKVLLKSELIESSAEERSLLKNLGAWLGKITIGRNRVLLRKEIDPKSLIMEAYEKGLMIGIIPFISKVLEPCKGSLAYRPPNPWTMGILGLLSEICAMPNLKVNLQFAIEITFKHLEVDLKAITPTSLLKDRTRKVEGNLDFSNKDVHLSQQPLVEKVISTIRSAESPHEASGPSYQDADSRILYQHAAPLHFPAVSSGENAFSLGLPNQLPPTPVPLVAQLPIEVPAPAAYIPEYQPFLLNMHFERVLPMVMDNAIKELLSTIVEKSISIATQTTMELVLKDIITDSDESYIYSTSCSIVVCLAGNLSYVTCKGPLRSKMSTHLRNSLHGLNIASEFLEHAMQRVIDVNLELGCASIEKAASDKGLTIIKKEVAHQLSIIRTHKEGANKLRVQQQSFPQPSSSNLFTSNTMRCVLTTAAALDEYQIISKKIEFVIARNGQESEIQAVAAEVPAVILRCNNKDEAALAVAQKVYQNLYENAANSAHVNAYVAILAAICSVSKLVGSELTGWVIHSNDDCKFNKDITVGLIRRELLNLNEYDAHMANLIDAGKNGAAMQFCSSLVQTLEADKARALSTLHNIVDALGKATKHHVASRDDDRASKSSGPDPPGFYWEVSMLFADWCQIRNHRGENDAASAHYVAQLHQNMLSKADGIPDHFFRHLLELAVSHCLSSEESNQETYFSPFIVIDIYTDLVFSILKFCPVDQGSNKLSLFSKVLAVIVRFIRKDAEENKASFSTKPYLRLFINLFLHFDTLDLAIDDANFQVLEALSNSLHALQPLIVPAFSFAWVELISHKGFMPKLFAANGQKGWPYFKRLLVDLLQFLEPFLRSGELTDPVRILYKGTLRVLLVLVHDYPDFICYYHFNFCEVIAPRCIQLRNIFLSTFPSNMRLPDPYSPNLKVDLLIEMSQPPCIDSKFDATLRANNMKRDVDEYIMMRPEQSSFLFKLKYKLLLSSSEAEKSGTIYNVPLMNSLVLYVGTKAIEQVQASNIANATSIDELMKMSRYFKDTALDIFGTLVLDLNSEGRYLFFNAVADQLRYPNNHTHYFSFVLLFFFAYIGQEEIQAQITRVLLERLITKLPHPWGVQVTFLELVKNPRYNFWKLNFTRCYPEMTRVFDSISTTFGIDVDYHSQVVPADYML